MSRRRAPKSAQTDRDVQLGNPADVVPADQDEDLGPLKRISFAVEDATAGATMRGARLYAMQHGTEATEGMASATDWLKRAATELAGEIEQRHNDGQPFPPPAGKMPRSVSGGAVESGAATTQFTIFIPVALEDRIRGILVYYRTAGIDDLRILTKVDFHTVAVNRLAQRLESEHGVRFAEHEPRF